MNVGLYPSSLSGKMMANFSESFWIYENKSSINSNVVYLLLFLTPEERYDGVLPPRVLETSLGALPLIKTLK